MPSYDTTSVVIVSFNFHKCYSV